MAKNPSQLLKSEKNTLKCNKNYVRHSHKFLSYLNPLWPPSSSSRFSPTIFFSRICKYTFVLFIVGIAPRRCHCRKLYDRSNLLSERKAGTKPTNNNCCWAWDIEVETSLKKCFYLNIRWVLLLLLFEFNMQCSQRQQNSQWTMNLHLTTSFMP